jgi:hypothetical protein
MENSSMKKLKRKYYFIFVFLVSAFAIIYFIWRFFFAVGNLQYVPKGEFLKEEISPTNLYTARVFRSSGGATTGFAIRVEIVFEKEKSIFGKKTKNIYWNYHEEDANIKWIDSETVKINNHQLNVITDTYDYRKDPNWKDPL